MRSQTNEDVIWWLGQDMLGQYCFLVIGPSGEPRIRGAKLILSEDVRDVASHQPSEILERWVERIREGVEWASATGAANRKRLQAAAVAGSIISDMVKATHD